MFDRSTTSIRLERATPSPRPRDRDLARRSRRRRVRSPEPAVPLEGRGHAVARARPRAARDRGDRARVARCLDRRQRSRYAFGNEGSTTTAHSVRTAFRHVTFKSRLIRYATWRAWQALGVLGRVFLSGRRKVFWLLAAAEAAALTADAVYDDKVRSNLVLV